MGIAVCLALLIVIAGAALYGFIKAGSRKGRIDYVRNFKRGKCIIVYIAVIPLYIIGLSYAGKNFGESFFGAISESADLIFLDCSLKAVSELVGANGFYTATMYFAFALVLINAILFTASIIQQMCWHAFKFVAWRRGERDRLIIFGDNECTRITYGSAKSHKGKIIVGKKLNRDEKYALYADGIMHSDYDTILGYIQKRLDKKAKSGKPFVKRTVLVVNTGDETENISLCRELVNVIEYVGYEKNKRKSDWDEKKKDFIRIEKLPKIDRADNEEVKKAAEQKIKDIKKKTVELFSHFCVYVFGDAANEAIYREIMQKSHGCIRYVNKYNRAAIDFIDEHPIAGYMDGTHIDYGTSLIKKDVDINVTMIGFGDTLRQVFLASVANNQFLTEGDGGKPVLKPVHYYIFDKFSAQNKNLNHSYYRYRNEFFVTEETIDEKTGKKTVRLKVAESGKYVRPDGIDESKYLELPDIPSDDKYFELDVNDPEFYIDLKNIFAKNGNSVNYVLVSYGTDLENIDLAQKLFEKKGEWGIRNLIVFVKVKTADDATDIFDRPDCFRISDYKNIFDINRIDNGALIRMSDSRNRMYAVENVLTENKGKKIPAENELADNKDKEITAENELADNKIDDKDKDKEITTEKLKEMLVEAIFNDSYKWYITKTQMERDSNTYASLSLKSKLMLMGLTYVRDEESGRGLSDEEYLKIYANDDMPEYVDGIDTLYTEKELEGKKIVYYDPLRFKPSTRTNLAIQEHYRWNSYILSNGLIPADKETILSESNSLWDSKGKNYALRRHGNLTTFDGLVEFRKIVAKKLCGDGASAEELEKSEAENDVIKYDYQLMDNAYWLLKVGGYKIIDLLGRKFPEKDEKSESEEKTANGGTQMQ